MPDNNIRKSFAFYSSFLEAIEVIENCSEKLAIYEAISHYAIYGDEPVNLSPICLMAWKLIKPQLSASMNRYDAAVENGKKGAEYGKRGGRPRKTKTPEKTPEHIPLNHNDNPNVNHNLSSLPIKEANEEELKKKKGKSKSVGLEKTDLEEKREVTQDGAPHKDDVIAFFTQIGRSEESALAFYQYNVVRKWIGLRNRSWTTLANEWRDVANGRDTITKQENQPRLDGMLESEFIAFYMKSRWDGLFTLTEPYSNNILIGKTKEERLSYWFNMYCHKRDVSFRDILENENTKRKKRYEEKMQEENEQIKLNEHPEF